MDRKGQRILFVGRFVGFAGGIERYAFAWAKQLAAEGATVDYVGCEPSRNEDLFRTAFRAVHAGVPETDYDEVVLHKLISEVAVRGLIARFGDRLSFFAHDHDLYCPRHHYYTPFGRRNCTRAFSAVRCRLCSLVTHPRNWSAALARPSSALLGALRSCRAYVISPFMRENLIRNGFAPSRIALAPAFVRAGDHPHPKRPADAPLRILFIGQLIAGKGCDLLLEAVRRVKVPWRLAVAGDGKDRPRLEATARGLTGGEVRFLGWVADPESLFDDADVLAFPSRWQEPFGLSGAEAVAHGVPVVAFDVGGVRTWADATCRLVPPGDVDAFARALEGVCPRVGEKA